MVVVSYYSKEGLTDVIKHSKSGNLSVSTVEAYFRKSTAVGRVAFCLTSGSFTTLTECSLSLKRGFLSRKKSILFPHRQLQVNSVLMAKRSE